MTDNRTQFTFYASIYASASRIRNKAARADFYDAICAYALNGTEPDLDKLSDAGAVGFLSAKPNLDASRRKAKSGKAGGSTKQTASKPQANGKHPASEKEKEVEKEKENEIEGENDKRSSAEAPPSDSGKPTVPPKSPPSFDGQSFSSFWSAYPDGLGKISRESTYATWKALAPSKETAAKILSSLEAWKKSSRWLDNGGAFVPSAANFLTKGYWKTTPVPAPASKKDNPPITLRKLDEEEREAIRRMLAESEEEVPQ